MEIRYTQAVSHRIAALRVLCLATAFLLSLIFVVASPLASQDAPQPRTELASHLDATAKLARSSPMVTVHEGWFLMGTNLQHSDRYRMAAPFDDTEQRLIWHVITVHLLPDYVLARWPALYVTWAEAAEFCRAQGKRLPTETEWEKAARGSDGNLFPWGNNKPVPGLAVFGQHHIHEIPLVVATDSGEEGQSPYGARHMAGNIAEWVQDWFENDYYVRMPERNPPGPRPGRYKSVRGGSWKSNLLMLRAATRNGAIPDQRAATIGFRCAK